MFILVLSLEITLFIMLYGGAVLLFIQLERAIHRFQLRSLMTPSSTITELPSVSVCIPARNEMQMMSACLQSVLSSSYPKLEILVVDDHSEDTTSSLVKAFAHDGVRFIEGTQLPEGWLGKNFALQELLDQASGTYVFFMDVDSRIAADTIEELVAYMQTYQLVMCSVLPMRSHSWKGGTIFAPLRYFFSIILHSKTFPAVASGAWMVHRKTLIEEQHGFHSLSEAIQPEALLARRFYEKKLYRPLLGKKELGVWYDKSWSDQAATAIRLLYPLVGSRWWAPFAVLFDAVILLLPFIIVFSSIWEGWHLFQTLSLIAALLYVGVYARYLSVVWPGEGWISAVLWPFILVQEVCLLMISAIRYQRGTITWKGRPIRIKH